MKTLTEEEIKERISQLRLDEKELRNQLDLLRQSDFYKIKSLYVGKYYKDKTYPSMEKHHRFFYVFGIEEVTCCLSVLEVCYWDDNETSHFDIQTSQFFEPNEEKFDKIEIDREEFVVGYNAVQARISKACTHFL